MDDDCRGRSQKETIVSRKRALWKSFYRKAANSNLAIESRNIGSDYKITEKNMLSNDWLPKNDSSKTALRTVV
jgi:hypothetical protein